MTQTPPQHSITRLRELVKDCLSKHMYDSAAFFADKLVTLSNNAPADIWLLAQQSDLIEQDMRCRYLAARCLLACEEWEECLQLLGEEADADAAMADGTPAALGGEVGEAAAYHLLRGRVYQALDNTTAAVAAFKTALTADPYCYEAFQALMDNHYLTNEEELALIDSLQVCPEDGWLPLLYRCRAKKYHQGESMDTQLALLEGAPRQAINNSGLVPGPLHFSTTSPRDEPPSGVRTRSQSRNPSATPDPSTLPWSLQDNKDVVACRADWLYHQQRFQECYALTAGLLARDPCATEHLPLHLAAALELKQKNELFLRAHKLVSAHPDKAVSWFAVGCYYMSTGQFESASHYFGKATSIEPRCAAAWVGFGHAFAAQDESDKAMAAYRTASRSFPGLHAPMLGMGMEYARMNNVLLAESIVLQAHRMCSADPVALHELGVLAYRQGRFEEAVSRFQAALEAAVPCTQRAGVEDEVMVNLGHAHRRLGQLQQAASWYTRALALCPHQSGTLAALGLTHHLQGDLHKAVEHYHKALGLRPDDTLTTDLLNMAVNGLEAEEAAALAAQDEEAAME